MLRCRQVKPVTAVQSSKFWCFGCLRLHHSLALLCKGIVLQFVATKSWKSKYYFFFFILKLSLLKIPATAVGSLETLWWPGSIGYFLSASGLISKLRRVFRTNWWWIGFRVMMIWVQLKVTWFKGLEMSFPERSSSLPLIVSPSCISIWLTRRNFLWDTFACWDHQEMSVHYVNVKMEVLSHDIEVLIWSRVTWLGRRMIWCEAANSDHLHCIHLPAIPSL